MCSPGTTIVQANKWISKCYIKSYCSTLNLNLPKSGVCWCWWGENSLFIPYTGRGTVFTGRPWDRFSVTRWVSSVFTASTLYMMKWRTKPLSWSWAGLEKVAKSPFFFFKDVNMPHVSVFLLNSSFIPVTKGRHELVPNDIKEEAEKYAKVSPSAISYGSVWVFFLVVFAY